MPTKIASRGAGIHHRNTTPPLLTSFPFFLSDTVARITAARSTMCAGDPNLDHQVRRHSAVRINQSSKKNNKKKEQQTLFSAKELHTEPFSPCQIIRTPVLACLLLSPPFWGCSFFIYISFRIPPPPLFSIRRYSEARRLTCQGALARPSHPARYTYGHAPLYATLTSLFRTLTPVSVLTPPVPLLLYLSTQRI